MKLFICAFVVLAFVQSTHASQELPKELGHFDLEMTSSEYRTQLKRLRDQNLFEVRSSDPLDDILKLGERNLDWLEAINKARPAGSKLELSTPDTTTGIPIDHPNQSNRQIILDKLVEIKAALPVEISQVLFSNVPLPTTIALDDATFLEHIRKVDRLYQNTSRWLMMEPYLWIYANRADNDIRGYFFLQQDPDRVNRLTNYKTLDPTLQQQYKEWLIGLCINTENDKSYCTSRLQSSLNANPNALKFYNQYVARAESTYLSFYELQNPRNDAIWSSAKPNLFTIPFRKPSDSVVEKWLKDNVEDEWKWNGWQLTLNFLTTGQTYVVFDAGATPHVNGLGGNEITMDANRDLQEYSSRWTIRHEYGHTLGFPDCYVEYYDSDLGVMINYQLDIDNLMCSRRGHLKQIHIDEMKKHYYSN